MNNNFTMVKMPTEKNKRKIIALTSISVLIILLIITCNIFYFISIKDNFSVKEYTFSDTKIEFKIEGSNKALEVQTKIINDGSIHTHFKYIDFDFAVKNKLIRCSGLMQRFMSFILQSKFFEINERAVYAYLLNEELSKKFDAEVKNTAFPEADNIIRFEGEEESNQIFNAENNNENISVEVFVTNYGKCYHLSDCRFLSQSKIPIELSEAKQKYDTCGNCNPPR